MCKLASKYAECTLKICLAYAEYPWGNAAKRIQSKSLKFLAHKFELKIKKMANISLKLLINNQNFSP
jgi:hypothetical protein